MLRFSTTLIAFSILTIGSCAALHADGLIKALPEDGAWASYTVETTITHKDGSKTSSTGTLAVRLVGKAEIDGTDCRWIEFEHSWEQEPTEKNSRRFHSSITKIAIDESAFSKNADPAKGIVAGYCDKASADQKPDKWNYTRVRKVERGKGSTTGYGALDYYVRASFDHPTEIGNQTITVSDKTFDCKGVEESETTHKLGVERNFITTTAFQQWTNSESPFGTVLYHFERIKMDGTAFNQKLVLKKIGTNAKTSLASVK
jgi:hypothetical protein